MRAKVRRSGCVLDMARATSSCRTTWEGSAPSPLAFADILEHVGVQHTHAALFERDHPRFLPRPQLAVDMFAAHACKIAEFGLAELDALRGFDVLAQQALQIAREPRARGIGTVAFDRLVGGAHPPPALAPQPPQPGRASG